MKSECSGDGALMFLAGFAAGAAVALLLAPQSGTKTRRKIVRTAEDAQEHLQEIGEDLIQKGRDLVKEARSAADDAVKQVGDRVKEARS